MEDKRKQKLEELFAKLETKGTSPEYIEEYRKIAAEADAAMRGERGSPELVKKLKDRKLPAVDIATLLGISRQGVYHHINGATEQLDQKDRTDIKSLRPFSVPSHQQQCTLYNNITNHIKYALDPTSLKEARLKVLRAWWKTLPENLVIVHDPEQPGNALAQCGGWKVDDRVPTDGDLIVRPHGPVSAEQKRVLSRKIMDT